MTTTLVPDSIGLSLPHRVQEEVARSVRLALWHNRPAQTPNERRCERRHPFPHPIELQPLRDDGCTSDGEPFIVLGKDLSEKGIGFYYRKPITARHALVRLTCGSYQATLQIELTWCRFGSHGLFENGGRIVQAVKPA